MAHGTKTCTFTSIWRSRKPIDSCPLFIWVMKWADTQGDTHRDTQEIHGAERSSGADSPALAALVEQLAVKDAQLAKKDEQIAKLMDAVADSTKAVQGAQALHHETAQTLALEPTEQKLSRWQRLKSAWRG